MIAALLRMVPMRWWIYLAIAAIALGTATTVHLKLQHEALATQAAHYEVALREQRDLYQGQIQRAHDEAQHQLDQVNEGWTKAFAQHQKDDAAKAAASARQAQALKDAKEFDRYVTPAQLARCPDVPRGYLVRRADAAAYANGAAEAAGPPPAASELDQPSGFPFAALWPIDVDAAGAYRACRARLYEWERWSHDVDTWAAQVQHALDGAMSNLKGDTP